jgi:hypothetical protein
LLLSGQGGAIAESRNHQKIAENDDDQPELIKSRLILATFTFPNPCAGYLYMNLLEIRVGNVSGLSLNFLLFPRFHGVSSSSAMGDRRSDFAFGPSVGLDQPARAMNENISICKNEKVP